MQFYLKFDLYHVVIFCSQMSWNKGRRAWCQGITKQDIFIPSWCTKSIEISLFFSFFFTDKNLSTFDDRVSSVTKLYWIKKARDTWTVTSRYLQPWSFGSLINDRRLKINENHRGTSTWKPSWKLTLLVTGDRW